HARGHREPQAMGAHARPAGLDPRGPGADGRGPALRRPASSLMDDQRFEKLEGAKSLPEEVQRALGGLKRFENLEIGAAKPAPEEPPGRLLCLLCGQPNEVERTTCWACFKPLRSAPPAPKQAAAAQDITLVLDGTTYKSSDPELPSDIRVLMDR